MSMIGFPLLLIPLAIVNIVVFLMGLELDRLQEPVVTFGLPVAAVVDDHVQRRVAGVRPVPAVLRGGEVRASWREILHRSSAVVHGVCRCGGRIPAAAASSRIRRSSC